MTTNYTSTIGITTPNVTYDSFTVTSSTDAGVNIYNSGTGFVLSNFAVGPTDDTGILNQLHNQLPGGYIHDGTITTVTGAGFAYGCHGIYDKGRDTLVERVTGTNCTAGQIFSVRWGNRYKSCVGHDQGHDGNGAVGHFNYQDSFGSGGILRFRDCIFYNIFAWVFYSDGVWKDINNNVLGNSTVIMEFDHCTFDLRNCGSLPFNFNDCHNTCYVTNSIVIWDGAAGAWHNAPSDGNSVFTTGTVVLSTAQRNTWLGAAPGFVPITGAGSPIIGLAGTSPPGCLAAWGNAADVGAVQSGSSPPPAAPTVSSFSPTSGPVGTKITVTGTNFTGATIASVNATNATPTVVSSTSLTFLVASGSTTGLVRVTTPNGTGTSSGNFTVGGAVTFPHTAVLDVMNRNDSASPPSSNWSNSIAVGDTALQDVAASLAVGSTGLQGTAWWKTTTFGPDSEVYVTNTVQPASGTGGVYLFARVTNPGTSSASGYVLFNEITGQTFLDKVTNGAYTTLTSWSGITPSAGDSYGFGVVGSLLSAYYKPVGGSWTLIGSFTDTTFSAAGFIGLGGDFSTIRMNNFGGGTVGSSPLPTISSFTPTSGNAGTSVTITGTNFTGTTAVKFNTVNASSFVINSGTSITAVAPTGVSTGVIAITNAGGTTSSGTTFTVVAPSPTITSFTPTSGPVGTIVIITGTNL